MLQNFIYSLIAGQCPRRWAHEADPVGCSGRSIAERFPVMGGDGKQEVNRKTDSRMLSGSVYLGGNREQTWQSGVTLIGVSAAGSFPRWPVRVHLQASFLWPLDSPICQAFAWQ